MIRRTNPATSGSAHTFGDITLDNDRHRVERNGQPVVLGPTEYRLLQVLISRPERVWSREQLLDRVWNDNLDIDFRTVDVHVGRLRKALKQGGKPDSIRTVRSAGYSLDFAR